MNNTEKNKESYQTDVNKVDIRDKRLNIMFKFLWFFGAIFSYGLYFLFNINIYEEQNFISMLPPLVISISISTISLLIEYILEEIKFFTTYEQNQKELIENTDFLYISINSFIKNSCIIFSSIYSLYYFLTPIIKFDIYDFNYWYLVSLIILLFSIIIITWLNIRSKVQKFILINGKEKPNKINVKKNYNNSI